MTYINVVRVFRKISLCLVFYCCFNLFLSFMVTFHITFSCLPLDACGITDLQNHKMSSWVWHMEHLNGTELKGTHIIPFNSRLSRTPSHSLTSCKRSPQIYQNLPVRMLTWPSVLLCCQLIPTLFVFLLKKAYSQSFQEIQ